MAFYVDEVAACVGAFWRPEIGDPTVVGWAITFAYAGAAILAARTARRSAGAREEAAFWTLTALALAALAVNKEFDVQTLLIAIGHCDAKLRGWYDVRRDVQFLLVGAFASGAIVVAVALTVLLRRAFRRVALALAGIVALLGFIVLRAAAFNHVDDLLGRALDSPRINTVLEVLGICLVAAGAARATATAPKET